MDDIKEIKCPPYPKCILDNMKFFEEEIAKTFGLPMRLIKPKEIARITAKQVGSSGKGRG